MSCTVSELPTGCRLRGLGSAPPASNSMPLRAAGNTSGASGSGANSSGNAGPSGSTSSAVATGTSRASTSVRNARNNVQDPPPQRQQSQKPCCFCWCCCCSCTCLAIKNAEDGPTRRDPTDEDLLLEQAEPPTLEEIRSWGKNFDKLMKNPAGRKVFRDFLRFEYSEENILFWLACEDLKRENNADRVENKARRIYEDYISTLSPKEVSLDSQVREIVNRNMVDPTTHTFDEAQIQIYTLMHRDSYPRFINSHIFKTLAQLPDDVPTARALNDVPP